MPGEVTPAAPAAAGAANGTTQAPASTPTGKEGEQKPLDLNAEMAAVLKKHGGLKFKSGGKEVTLDDPSLIVRRLQNVDGLEASANELLKVREASKREADLRARLKSEKNPSARVKLLRELAGEDSGFDEAAEALVLERFESERAKEKLTPNERKLREDLDRERQAREKAEKRQKELDDEAERQAVEAQTNQIRTQLFGVTSQQLQKVGVQPEHAARYLPEVAAFIRRAAELRLQVSPDDIAEHIVTKRDAENTGWLSGMTDEALLDKLEKLVDQVDGKPGPSRAKRLANLMAKRALERVQSGTPNTGTSSIIPNVQNRQPANGGGKAPEFAPSYWNTVRK